MGERSFRDRSENELQSMGALVIAQTSSFPEQKTGMKSFPPNQKFAIASHSSNVRVVLQNVKMILEWRWKNISLNELRGKKKKVCMIRLDGGSMFESKWGWLEVAVDGTDVNE